MDTVDDPNLWRQLFNVEQAARSDIFGLWCQITSKVEVLQGALSLAHQRGTALRILLLLGDDLRKPLFPQLVELASVGHADILLCRTVIKCIERAWVVSNFPPVLRKVLNPNSSAEEYRRIAELLREVDPHLIQEHIERSLAHPDPEIHEVGHDFRGG